MNGLPENSFEFVKFVIQFTGLSALEIQVIFPDDVTLISPSIIISNCASTLGL